MTKQFSIIFKRFYYAANMRDKERDLWCIGAGRFLSHSDELESGLHSLSLQRLDALIYTNGKLETSSCIYTVSVIACIVACI